jgi:hypothetical protein
MTPPQPITIEVSREKKGRRGKGKKSLKLYGGVGTVKKMLKF